MGMLKNLLSFQFVIFNLYDMYFRTFFLKEVINHIINECLKMWLFRILKDLNMNGIGFVINV